jgi:DNA-binding NtrC family response regulator
MKSTNVLLLDCNPGGGEGAKLRGILEAARGDSVAAEINLQQQALGQDETRQQDQGRVAELLSRFNPAVIFLVASNSLLRQSRNLFQSLRRREPEPAIIVVADNDQADASPDEVFEMIRLGATDFITPPLKPVEILPRLWRALEHSRLGETIVQALRGKLSRPLIGSSPAFLSAVSKIPLVAGCDASILISGETGTGKEVCARAIHELSPRKERPFIPINCGAIPLELVENELFGHERGAFTHASAAQQGLIQSADGGTLFLDEIDSLPLLAQVKLLRFLQEKEYKPLGSTRTRHADVRVITATNVNVEKAVREGRLRQDLYYRLNMIPVVLPPLRERREDIHPLALNFLLKYNREFNKRIGGFAPEALQKLTLHDWPGNVRELEHVVARAVALSEHTIIRGSEITLAPSSAEAPPESFQELKARMVEQFERTYLQSLLIAHQGNISKAAEAAHKNRRAFFELLRKHRIDASEFKPRAE